jgi:acyl-coenzyme A synthetase/AMP-(fatty) acid ligase
LKIDGVRIHLNEISRKINSFHDKSITDCTVLYTNGDLIAFYISLSDIDIEKLKSFLKTRLMQIHMPKKFIRLNQFPTTINGKLDRDKLLAEYCS